jgi:type I restriction enzyme S subunit
MRPLYKNEILFNRTNSKELVGKTAVYRQNEPMVFAGYLVKLIVNDRANPEYIGAYLNSKHGKAFLLNKAKSIVGMANINAEELKRIKISIPPLELQNVFAERVQKIEAQKEAMKASLGELEDNFNSLMQRVFKGELVL